MSVSNRSRPFHLTFEVGGSSSSACTAGRNVQSAQTVRLPDVPRQKVVPINAYAPIEIENEYFKGRINMIHETGSEPEMDEEDWVEDPDAQDQDGQHPMRGVELQLQGKFKKPCGLHEKKTGLWIGAELKEPLNLGWVMQNIATLGVKFAKKKADGNFHYSFGGRTELPIFAFPVSQAFMICATSPGEEPPRLGRISRSEVNWLSSGPVEFMPDFTYTLVSRTPYLDLCTWEILSVPGLSPMPIERIVGDVTTARLRFYDIGSVGSHARSSEASLLEFVVTRAKVGERWQETDPDGAKTPLDVESDPSECSDAEDGDVLVDATEDHASDHSDDDSESDGDPVEEDVESLSRAESQVLSEIDGWKPSQSISSLINAGVRIGVPYYIEAIDRRRRSRLVDWYVFTVADVDERRDWWHAMAVAHLVPFVRQRPKMNRTFRRGKRTAVVKRYGVLNLEKFRHAVCNKLVFGTEPSQLRRALAKAAHGNFDQGINHGSSGEVPDDVSKTGTILRMPNAFAPGIAKLRSLPVPVPAQQLANQVKKRMTTTPLFPPLFFASAGSRACELAFTHAREGRNDMLREGLVGALHFEGRICEELLRISADGVVRCFAPHDCDRPRLRLPVAQITKVQLVEGLFLGRFHLWELHTALRVYVFCTADMISCKDWVEEFASVASAHPMKQSLQWPLPANKAYHLMDSTNAQRWQKGRRLVLNDRVLLAQSNVKAPEPIVAVKLLDRVLTLPERPTLDEIAPFLNATCILKAVRFIGWSQEEYLAFWLNVYHCLLLHGRLVVGAPKSKSEFSKFKNRVSYLVGLAPISLRDIERQILRVPISDAISVNAVTSRAKKGQVTAMNAMSSMNSVASRFYASFLHFFASNGTQAQEAENGSQETSYDSTPMAKWLCFPSHMHVPLPGLLGRRLFHPCLFMGHLPGKASGYVLPSRDLRVIFCLNRGNLASIPGIPVFSVNNINSQLDEVSQFFMSKFAEVIASSTGPPKLVLPQVCRGLWRELERNPRMLIRFIWQFMPPPQAEPPQRLLIVFRKFEDGPQRRSGLQRIVLKSDPFRGIGLDFDCDGHDVQCRLHPLQLAHEDVNLTGGAVVDLGDLVSQNTRKSLVQVMSV